jgi:type IV secretion system protein VirB5
MQKVRVLAGMAVALMCSTVSQAQIAVIDPAAIAKQIEQMVEMAKQLQTAKDQLAQAEKLFGSMNKLTNMGDIASALSSSDVRSALGTNFAAVQSALSGHGGNGMGANADRYKADNEVYTRPGEDYYAQASRRSQAANAGQASVAQAALEAADKRMDGLKELQRQIGQSEDPKTVMDLQARIGVEMAQLQNETVRMQALAMLQTVEAQTQDAQARQNYDKKIDKNLRALGVDPGGSASQ